jgi:hypothetical protein
MKILLPLLMVLTSLHLTAQTPLPFFHQGDVVVFQGDSITDGGRWRTGEDYNHIMGQDYAYIVAAKAGAEYPERGLTFIRQSRCFEEVFRGDDRSIRICHSRKL